MYFLHTSATVQTQPQTTPHQDSEGLPQQLQGFFLEWSITNYVMKPLLLIINLRYSEAFADMNRQKEPPASQTCLSTH